MKLKDQQSFSAENLTKQLQISLRSVLCITTFSPLWRYYININQATSTNQTNTLVYSIMKEGYFHDYKISVQSEEEESQWPTDNQQSLIYIQPRMVCLNQGTIQISVKLFNDFNYILNLPLQKPMQNIISLEDYQPDYYSQNRRKNTQDDKKLLYVQQEEPGLPRPERIPHQRRNCHQEKKQHRRFLRGSLGGRHDHLRSRQRHVPENIR